MYHMMCGSHIPANAAQMRPLNNIVLGTEEYGVISHRILLVVPRTQVRSGPMYQNASVDYRMAASVKIAFLESP